MLKLTKSSIWVSQTYYFLMVAIASSVSTFFILLCNITGVSQNLHHYKLKASLSFGADFILFVLNLASCAAISYFCYYTIAYQFCMETSYTTGRRVLWNSKEDREPFIQLYNCDAIVALVALSILNSGLFLTSLVLSARVFGPILGSRCERREEGGK